MTSQTAYRHPRSGEWLEDPGFGVYVHVPFCKHRCHYCDFNTYEGMESSHASYVDALVRDIARWKSPTRPATSVFFGGGTPTLLPPTALRRVLGAITDRFGLAPGAEVTVECNPETVDEETFAALLDGGFTRFSIGVQSASDRVLAALGRTHDATCARAAVRAARSAGADDVNVDLIYGSPWESSREWAATLDAIVQLGPEHVSAYALTVEEGTPLATLVATGRAPDVDQDVQAERFEVAADTLARAGFERYEISNWSLPGHACRHNLLYWSGGDYVGFGPGAHSHVAGRRWWNLRLPREYIAAVNAGRGVEAGHEVLEADRRAGEALMLGLRLAGGIRADGFKRRFGDRAWEPRREALQALSAKGLLEQTDGFIKLSGAGTLVANEVAAALL